MGDRPDRTALRALLRALGRAYPFVRGTGRLPESQLARDLTAGMTNPVSVRLRSGYQLIVVPADWDGRYIYFMGDQDRAISSMCRALLAPGDTALDIGANCGVMTHWCALAVGPTGAVHAFEPQRRLAKSNADSAELNDLPFVHVHHMALSDADGELDLFVPNTHSGGASLGKRGDSGSLERVRVACGAHYLQSIGVTSARLIKMDVEGHESQVLIGLDDLLRPGGADFVLFEVLPELPAETAAADEILRGFGYSIYSLVKRLDGVELVSRSRADRASVTDCLAVRPGLDVREELAAAARRMPWNARVRVAAAG
jgi:FkbM family methyltransferase